MELLNLSNNQLRKLPADIFKGLGKLSILHLYDNQLQILPEDLFQELTNLRKVNLSANFIPGTTEEFRKKYLAHIPEVELEFKEPLQEKLEQQLFTGIANYNAKIVQKALQEIEQKVFNINRMRNDDLDSPLHASVFQLANIETAVTVTDLKDQITSLHKKIEQHEAGTITLPIRVVRREVLELRAKLNKLRELLRDNAHTIIVLLLDHGADLSLKIEDKPTPFETMLQFPETRAWVRELIKLHPGPYFLKE